MRASPELVALGKDGRDQERFTSRDMIAVEARLERAGDELARREEHGLPAAAIRGLSLLPGVKDSCSGRSSEPHWSI
ncbi:hypothetical protein GCM10020258_58710 [Sphingomonas yabuuchiae]